MKGTYRVGQITEPTAAYGYPVGAWVILRVYGNGVTEPVKNQRTGLPITYKSKERADKRAEKMPATFDYGYLSEREDTA
jgi:hypothetical protein